MAENINKNFLDPNWWDTATVEDIKAELAKGADINVIDKYGWTPLITSVQYNKNIEIIKKLIKSS